MSAIANKSLILDEIVTDGEATRSLAATNSIDSPDEDTFSPGKKVTFDPNNRFNVAGKWGVIAFYSFQFNLSKYALRTASIIDSIGY